jgi:uncharacterized radical SAM superfamily Fe-S cluster-containing enzyme
MMWHADDMDNYVYVMEDVSRCCVYYSCRCELDLIVVFGMRLDYK